MLKKVLILIFVVAFAYSQSVSDIINDKVDFKNIPGFQVRLAKTNDGFLYCNLTGNETTMNGTCHLFLKKTKSEVENDTNGAWAGIGFGSPNMLKLDMVTFHFWKTPMMGTSPFMVGDCWSTATVREVILDMDIGKDNKYNSISNTSFDAVSIDVGGYKTQLIFNFSKNVGTVDEYDWQDAKNWQTNKGQFTGTWGWNKSNGDMTQHTITPTMGRLLDGYGLTSTSSYISVTILTILVLVLF